MEKINDYYREDFRSLPKAETAVILPHCLIGDKCPASFSKFDGIICRKCDLCGCGKIRMAAEEHGYQFYITPSVGFTKRLIRRKGLRGVLGIVCDYEIERGISSENISDNGVKISQARIVTQGIQLSRYNCVNNSVDWDRIIELINER